MIWSSGRYFNLGDLVLPPPLPALIALLITLGLVRLGRLLARRLKCPDDMLHATAAFVAATALVGAVAQLVALAHLAPLVTLRLLGWGIAALGVVEAVKLRPSTVLFSESRGVERIALGLGVSIIAAYGLAALGPATDADSLDYHLGVPIDWLSAGGVYGRPDWFHARLVGVGESLNMLGLAAGTDGLGAMLQLSGLIVAAVALATLSRDDRGLAVLLVAAVPVAAFLVPSQKPQMLPAAATTLALVLALRHDVDRSRAVLAAIAIAFAAASKHSFVMSATIVSVVLVWRARQSGQVGAAMQSLIGAFVFLAAPVWWRNFSLYGDPVSPFLEWTKSQPHAAVATFASDLRHYGGELSARNVAGMVVTTDPSRLSTVLGVGAFAAIFARGGGRTSHVLLGAAAMLAVATFAVGQVSGRYFLEAYFWAGGAAVAGGWAAAKRTMTSVLCVQGVMALAMAGMAAWTLLPGGITRAWRERLMVERGDGYAEAKWMDGVLPGGCLLMTDNRSHAVLPRRFQVWHEIGGRGLSVEEKRAAWSGVGQKAHWVISWPPEEGSVFAIAVERGEQVGEGVRIRRAYRNPFREAEEVEWRVFRPRAE